MPPFTEGIRLVFEDFIFNLRDANYQTLTLQRRRFNTLWAYLWTVSWPKTFPHRPMYPYSARRNNNFFFLPNLQTNSNFTRSPHTEKNMDSGMFFLRLNLFLGTLFACFPTVAAQDAADTIGTILFVLIILTCVCAGLGYYKRSRG